VDQQDAATDARGLSIETVEWLPSGAESDLVRVRGRSVSGLAVLPELVIAGQRLQSLPDPRAASDLNLWRGAYLVPSELFPPAEWFVEWPGGPRLALGEPSRGLVDPPRRAPVVEEEDAGGEVIDRAVLAERRARRAEASEQAQARIAAQALKAVELLELRANELERERNDLLGRGAAEQELRQRLALAEAKLEQAPPRGPELAAAIEAAARARGQARDWRLHLRVSEIARTSDAVRLAVLESSMPEASRLRAALAERERELSAARPAAAEAESLRSELEAARADALQLSQEVERLESDRADIAEAQAEAARARVDLRSAETAARAESVARTALSAELDRTRAELERLRRGLTPVRPGKTDLATAAAAQIAASRAASTAPARDLAADFDAAAAALRSRVAPPKDAEPAGGGSDPAAAAAPAAAQTTMAVPAPIGSAPVAPAPAPSSGPTRGRDAGGSQEPEGDDLPWLRGALVRMAREDPQLAGRLIVGLLPAQGPLIDDALEYDLTIRGLGTFAVSLWSGQAKIESVLRRRSRRRTAFHLAADPVVLAEILAGRKLEIGRFSRRCRVRGREVGRLEEVRLATHAPYALSGAARSGARLDPDPIFRAFPYAIHPGWTRGHSFCVAQEVRGEGEWFVSIADGAPVRVTTERPTEPPAATVSMSRTTFDLLLRREPPPPGGRPAIRGDRRAVELLRTWTDRAQGLG
jgi:hypothetical protein